MATVTCLGVSYPCATALKGENYIHLLDENGVMIVAFDDITDFYNFEITDGEWTTPKPHGACKVAVFREDGVLVPGPHKCSDIARPVNLLDNSDFRNPVNQRGQSSYTTAGVYSVDRWLLDKQPSGEEGGISIDSGHVHFVNNAAEYVGLEQRILVDEKALKAGNIYTAAYEDGDGNVYSASFALGENASGVAIGALITYSVTSSDSTYIAMYFRNETSGTSVVVKWIALYEGEYTADTLPKYIPKGYSAELTECMRYFQYVNTHLIASSITTSMRYYPHTLPVVMRTTPTITIDTGTEYQVMSATGATVSTNNTYSNMFRVSASGTTTSLTGGYWVLLKAKLSADL